MASNTALRLSSTIGTTQVYLQCVSVGQCGSLCFWEYYKLALVT